MALDLSLGVGGLAWGSIVRISGIWGAGKTALMMKMAGQHIRSGRPVLWIDTESGFHRQAATWNGLDYRSPLFDYRSSQTHNEVVTYEMMAMWVEAFLEICIGETQPLVIIDSISNLSTAAMLKKDVGEPVIAGTAKANTQWTRIVHVLIKEADAVVVMSEQMRANFDATGFGAPTSTHGNGFAIGHNAQTIIELAKVKQLNKGDEISGHIIGFKIVKNRFDLPYRKGQYTFMYDGHRGIDTLSEIIALGASTGVIGFKKGGFYTFSYPITTDGEIEDKTIHGADAARDWLSEHPGIAADYERQIRAVLCNQETDLAAAPADDEEAWTPPETEES